MPGLDAFREIIRKQEPLAQYTWLRLGGAAEYLAEPRTVEELSALVRTCSEQDLPVRLLGGGSNLLVRDEGVRGVVVRLTAPVFSEIKIQGKQIEASGGAKLSILVSTAVRQGLAGLESLVGIPGTVGGALHGNAGNRGGDIGQWARQAVVLTKRGEIHTRRREDLNFAYRRSSLDELVILSATFELTADDPQELAKRMQKQWIVTKANQPLGHQNTGCVFKNPRGMSAGMLIEQVGLRGAKVGGAEISDRHGNFVIAHPGARSADVIKLIETVKRQVSERLGIELETEIEIW